MAPTPEDKPGNGTEGHAKDPGGQAEDPGRQRGPIVISSGTVKQLYPFICDLLCHVLNKDPISPEIKSGLVESLSPDLDYIDSKYITPLIGNSSEAKVLTITGIAVIGQKKKVVKLKDLPGKPAEAGQPPEKPKEAPGGPSGDPSKPPDIVELQIQNSDAKK